ncbi:hypothetical protein C9Z00_18255, partial [Escherichia coli]
GCNPTSSKFIHTWLRFGEIMRGSLSARYLSGLWLVAFLGTVYILLLVKSMRVVLTALIDREVTSLPSPQIHLVPHSQIQHSCHAIWRFAGQSIAQARCR